jgi:hypothetical protein
MYSYHIVAELRQFRGVYAATGQRIHSRMSAPALVSGTDVRPSSLTGMDRFFLAMMVSAVLLLIVAADRLVNGPGMLEPAANVANVVPGPGRLVR